MFIKLLGENGNGFPLDCTVGKVYEIVNFEEENFYFINDVKQQSFACTMQNCKDVGQWQVVDKNGEAV